MQDIKALLERDASSRDARTLQQRYKKEAAAFNQKQRSLYSNMFKARPGKTGQQPQVPETVCPSLTPARPCAHSDTCSHKFSHLAGIANLAAAGPRTDTASSAKLQALQICCWSCAAMLRGCALFSMLCLKYLPSARLHLLVGDVLSVYIAYVVLGSLCLEQVFKAEVSCTSVEPFCLPGVVY